MMRVVPPLGGFKDAVEFQRNGTVHRKQSPEGAA